MKMPSTPRNEAENPELLPGYATRWWGLLFICISLLVISLDNTILNVALPAISRDLNADGSDLQWIVDAYILVFASLLLTMGAAGDRWGRKKFLQAGLVLFGIGSLWAAVTTSTNGLIQARAFTGIGGAIIMPSTLSIISASFPSHERAQAFAIWAATFGLGVGVGPVTGGLLLEYFEWNSVFYINLPVMVVAIVGGYIYLVESSDDHAPQLDLLGVLLSITGLFALVYAIIEAGVKGWTEPEVLQAFAAAAVLLGTFAWWENRNPNAMLPLYFFRNMSFTGANTALAMVVFSLFGSLFFLSQYLQSVLGYTALESGIRLLPLALTLMVTSAGSAIIADRLGTKYTVALGIAIAATGLLLMSRSLSVDTTYPQLLGMVVFFAFGMGLTMSPATNSIMQSVPVSKAGIGSAMNDTTRELGGAMGVAVLGTFLNNTYIDGVAGLGEKLPMLPQAALDAISNSVQGAHMVASDPLMPADMGLMIKSAADQAFVDGMTNAMLIGSFIMYAAVLITLVILPNQVQVAADEPETHPEKQAALEPSGALPSPATSD